MNAMRLSVVFGPLAGLLLSACSSVSKTDPSKARAYVEEGREAAKQGDHTRAVDLYSSAIAADPRMAEAWYSRGYSNVQLRRSPEAPEYSRGYEDRAIADYSQAIQLNPMIANAYYNRAMLYSSRAMYRPAAEDLLNAIKLNDKDADVHLELAHLYEQKFEDMIPQAMDHYEKYTDLGGRDRDAREKARLWKEQKKAVSSIPKPPTEEDEKKAQELHQQMKELLKEGKRDEALKAANELLTTYGRTKYLQDPALLTGLKVMIDAYKKAPPK